MLRQVHIWPLMSRFPFSHWLIYVVNLEEMSMRNFLCTLREDHEYFKCHAIFKDLLNQLNDPLRLLINIQPWLQYIFSRTFLKILLKYAPAIQPMKFCFVWEIFCYTVDWDGARYD